MRRRLLLAACALAVAATGAAVAYVLLAHDTPGGHPDTELAGVTVTPLKGIQPAARSRLARAAARSKTEEGPCWTEFGGDPQRRLARPNIHLGLPGKPLWARSMGSYLEYPPSFCDGTLYVNTNDGLTMAIEAGTGKILWRRRGGIHASTPAIAGPRLIVSSHDGSVAALARATGRPLWKLQTDAKVESSPVVIDGTAYFGVTDGRVFAVDARTGRVRWAYDTEGRINSSPSVWGHRLCVSTYAGSIFCLDRRDGSKLWSTYVGRDALRYESFYASPSTDGRRLYTMSRAGKVIALNARTGRTLWTRHVGGWGYSTPAIARGLILVGGYDNALHAYRARTGELVWERHVGVPVEASAVVVGDLVFFSTVKGGTFAARLDDGKIVWSYGLGQFIPLIATNRRYYFSVGGMLVAMPGRSTPSPATSRRH